MAAGRRPDPAGSGRIPEERLWQVGFLVGSVLGAAVTVAGRRIERSARQAGLVDWRRVEAIAIARLRTAPGSLSAAEIAATEGDYAAAMARVVPALSEHLGTHLPGVVDRVEVVDRATWVRANTSAFAGLIGRLEGELLDQMLPPGSGVTKATMTLANRWVTTRLLFVEENIRHTARVMDVPLGPFRTWIALHETTHAFEFEAHPWLRPYLADRLERQISLFSDDAASLGREAARALGASLRGDGRRDDQHWLERLMTDEQRRLFRETQAIMSLLEGFGDHVMDAVGKDLVPGVARISARFHGRREQRTPFERAMLRITGMDLKMDQYRKGEAFVAGIERIAGAAALRRLWDGPETLPTPGEITNPDAWVRRMGLNQLEGGTA
jgi:uncharacterized protein (DUF2342 family)